MMMKMKVVSLGWKKAGMILKELDVFFVCIMTLCAKQLGVKWFVLDFWF
jgi:hypothetical protein